MKTNRVFNTLGEKLEMWSLEVVPRFRKGCVIFLYVADGKSVRICDCGSITGDVQEEEIFVDPKPLWELFGTLDCKRKTNIINTGPESSHGVGVDRCFGRPRIEVHAPDQSSPEVLE